MKQTKNRQAIIKCLTEPNTDCGGAPSYSARSIQYMLGNEYYGTGGPVSISQINRTLRTLRESHQAGLVVFEERIDTDTQNPLPQRVRYWQVADAVDRNKLMADVVAITGLAKKAHRVLFFGDLVAQPFSAEQKAGVIKQLKGFMQRAHPDKTDGFDDQFWQLQDALSYVRSNVDLTKDQPKLESK